MSATAYKRLIDALEAGGSTGRDHGDRAQFQCPSHDDRKPSLTVTDRPDRALLHCFAGCGPRRVLDALGLTWRDLFDGDGARHERPRNRRRQPARVEPRQQARPLADVDVVLDAFRDAGLSWRCTPGPGSWCAECPVCRDPRLSVCIIDFTDEPGREDEPLLVACVNGCQRTAIAQGLQEARA